MNEQAEAAAKLAINHTLCQIRDNKKVQHELGACTETFALLTQAASLLFNESVDEVRDNIIPGSSSFYKP